MPVCTQLCGFSHALSMQLTEATCISLLIRTPYDADNVTGAQVVEFQAATAAFLASLLEQGPGRHAADLPAGLEALRRFQKQLEAMAKQREQLALAEHLFDLEQTFYQELSKVRAGCAATVLPQPSEAQVLLLIT